MSGISLEALYLGISSMLDANKGSTESLAGPILFMAQAYTQKQDLWQSGPGPTKDDPSTSILYDVEQYLIATITPGPGAQAEASKWSEQRIVDTSKMDNDLSNTQIVVENLKTGAIANQADLQSAMQAQVPVNEFFKSIINLLARGG